MRITWLGHSAFELEKDGKVLLIDPFITGNPAAPKGVSEIRADAIAVTHAHGDHLGDALEISKRTGAPVIAIFEIAQYLAGKGANTMGINMGGEVEVAGFRVAMVPATHSSTIMEGGRWLPGGCPAGFVIDNKVYHAGDTGLFYGMKLIGEYYRPEVALLPIGGFYTMDVRQAAKAAELLGVKAVIPMHYNTFDVIRADPRELERLLEPLGIKVYILRPGESVEV
ncbi:MAG: metal-dependent hydrolase [Thermoplasmata archaeon]|nr:MAG: metal-dependent hydrolase [Thermoplasmata archaeon]